MSTSPQRPELPVVVTSLMKGVVYREANEALWRDLLASRAQLRDVVALMGLQAVVDESEGYAYLRSQPEDERDERIPRLVPRRELPFDVSLLLALLRKRLAQSDSESGDTRLVVTRAEIADMLRVFLGGGENETRTLDRVDALVRRVVELGFLRPARSPDAEDAAPVARPNDTDDAAAFEVRRILKAFVDAQWLADFDARLAAYQESARGPHDQGRQQDHRTEHGEVA